MFLHDLRLADSCTSSQKSSIKVVVDQHGNWHESVIVRMVPVFIGFGYMIFTVIQMELGE